MTKYIGPIKNVQIWNQHPNEQKIYGKLLINISSFVMIQCTRSKHSLFSKMDIKMFSSLMKNSPQFPTGFVSGLCYFAIEFLNNIVQYSFQTLTAVSISSFLKVCNVPDSPISKEIFKETHNSSQSRSDVTENIPAEVQRLGCCSLNWDTFLVFLSGWIWSNVLPNVKVLWHRWENVLEKKANPSLRSCFQPTLVSSYLSYVRKNCSFKFFEIWL